MGRPALVLCMVAHIVGPTLGRKTNQPERWAVRGSSRRAEGGAGAKPLTRCLLIAALSLSPLAGGRALAVGAESWEASTAEVFAGGTLDGTAIDRHGRIVLAPRVEPLWGPGEGIVWSVLPAPGDGALVALGSPGRVLRVESGSEETWYEAPGETLVTALADAGAGRVWFGLSPDGRVMRTGGSGEIDVELETGAKFVWALAAGEDGVLWIGTGVPGMLERWAGKRTELVFESGDDPVRAVLPYPGGVLIGTGGRGRVLRIGGDERAFVLLDADEEEIVSLARAADGTIWALAASGARQVSPAGGVELPPGVVVGDAVRVVAPAPEGGDESREAAPPSPSAVRASPRFQVPPGGGLYRLDPDGSQRRIWDAGTEIPFAVALADDGTLFVATGDEGRLHAIDREGRAARLLRIPSDQASAMRAEGPGRLLVGGTTDARVVRLSFESARTGSYLSPAIDAGTVADWGVVDWSATLPRGAGVVLRARAGNSGEPDETWTAWRDLGSAPDGTAPTELPATRWIQLRADLEAGRELESPSLGRLAVHYRPRNRAPVVSALTVDSPGVVWTLGPAPTTRQGGPAVSDDPVTRRAARRLEGSTRLSAIRKSWEAGARTFHWTAADPDDDELIYRLELQPEGESVWIPLATGLADPFHSWDARGVPDGRYRVRLSAGDAADNPRGAELEGERVSELFAIDNTRPAVEQQEARREERGWRLEFVASDPDGRVAAVELALGGGEWMPVDPVDGVADSPRERYRVELPADAVACRSDCPLMLRVTDAAGNLGGALWILPPR